MDKTFSKSISRETFYWRESTNIFKLRPPVGSREVHTAFSQLHTLYQQTYVISEVQALYKGLEIITHETHATSDAFPLYWIGKVAELFEKFTKEY